MLAAADGARRCPRAYSLILDWGLLGVQAIVNGDRRHLPGGTGGAHEGSSLHVSNDSRN